ncbi:MAG: hypothetical protein IPG64_19370 [Haliea sp.]|nr:hypothetical protein [Haliea sp.]
MGKAPGGKISAGPATVLPMAAVSEEGDDTEGARALHQQGLDLAPTNVLARYNLARLAREKWRPGNGARALPGVLLAQPGHLPSVVALAQIALETGQPQDALALLEQARDNNPGAVGLALELADLTAAWDATLMP